MAEEGRPLDEYDVIAIAHNQFAGIDWQKLGLQPDPMNNQIDLDLGQAKIAIDIAENLSDHLEGSLDDDDRRELHILIRNLRLNYVQKAKDGQS